MPCYDPDARDRPIRLEAKVHQLTDMLCFLCGKTDQSIIDQNPKLAEWWKKHKEQDARIDAVKRKFAAGLPLSDYEHRVLYIDRDISIL